MAKASHPVFTDEFDFWEVAFAWISALVTKLQLARRLVETQNDRALGYHPPATLTEQQRNAIPVDETERQLSEATEEEACKKADLDARLEQHRAHPDATKLAIDTLTDEHDLDHRERLVLMAALIPTIGRDLSEDVFGEWSPGRYGGGGLDVDNLITMMEPEGLRERVEFRSYFTADSKLVRASLVVVDHVRGAPAEVLDAEVKLSGKAWQTFSGQPTGDNEVSD